MLLSSQHETLHTGWKFALIYAEQRTRSLGPSRTERMIQPVGFSAGAAVIN